MAAPFAPTDAPIPPILADPARRRRSSLYLDRVNAVPGDIRRHEVYSQSSRGKTPEPYCLFHAAGKAIYGTVVLFHGFNDRPHQQAKLASYLFHNGFDSSPTTCRCPAPRRSSTGVISPDNVGQTEPDADLPTPACAMPDFSARCGE